MRHLREEYKKTWRALSGKMQEVQTLTEAPVRDYAAIEKALDQVSAVRGELNSVRDRIARALNPEVPVVVKFRYAATSASLTPAPAKTMPSLTTRA